MSIRPPVHLKWRLDIVRTECFIAEGCQIKTNSLIISKLFLKAKYPCWVSVNSERHKTVFRRWMCYRYILFECILVSCDSFISCSRPIVFILFLLDTFMIRRPAGCTHSLLTSKSANKQTKSLHLATALRKIFSLRQPVLVRTGSYSQPNNNDSLSSLHIQKKSGLFSSPFKRANNFCPFSWIEKHVSLWWEQSLRKTHLRAQSWCQPCIIRQ